VITRTNYIYKLIRHIGSHKTFNNYREKEKEEKQANQSFTAFSHIRRDMELHLTNRPVYLKSLQSPFLGQNISLIHQRMQKRAR